MDMKKYLRVWAVFMVCLVVSIPVIVANQFGTVSVEGKDNIAKIRRQSSDDHLDVTFAVQVESAPAGIDESYVANNLVARDDAYSILAANFACVSTGQDWYNCQAKLHDGDQEELTSGDKTYSLVLFQDYSSYRADKDFKFAVDGDPPSIDLDAISDVSTGDVELTYTAQDVDYGTDLCSGVDKIDIYYKDSSSDEFKKLRTISVDEEGCEVSDTERVSSAVLSNGLVTVCLVPYDRLDNYDEDYLSDGEIVEGGNNCQGFVKDSTKPSVTSVRFNGESSIGYMKNNVILSFNVEANITAGVRPLTLPTFTSENLGVISPVSFSSCDNYKTEGNKNYYACTGTFSFKVSSEGPKNYEIYAEDEMGNSYTYTSSTSVEMDDTPPRVTAVESYYLFEEGEEEEDNVYAKSQFNDEYYLTAENNRIVVRVDEDEAGFDDGAVELHIENRVKDFDECLQGGVCVLEDYDLSDADMQRVQAAITGQDDVGNAISIEGASYAFKVDTGAPVISSDVIIDNGNRGPTLVDSSEVIISINITDDIAVANDDGVANVFADFSEFADPGVYSNAMGECSPVEEGSKTWVCKWEVEAMNFGGEEPITAVLTVKDFVGNPLEEEGLFESEAFEYESSTKTVAVSKFIVQYTQDGKTIQTPLQEVEVYGFNADINELWELQYKEEDAQPTQDGQPFIDKNWASADQWLMWLPLELTTEYAARNPRIMDVTFLGCPGEESNYDDYIYEPDTRLMLSDALPLTLIDDKVILYLELVFDPYIIFEEDQELINLMGCQLSVVTGVGDEISSEPQILEFNASIPIGDAADISDEVWDDIMHTYGSFWVHMEFIETVKDWIGVAEKLCNIMTTIFIVGEFLVALDTAAQGWHWAGVTKITGPIVDKYNELDNKVVFKTLRKACGWLTCQNARILLSEKWNDWYTELYSKVNFITREAPGYERAVGPDLQRATGEEPVEGRAEAEEQSVTPWSPRDSLLLSLLTFCLPGIIENLQKIRETDCEYMRCMYEDVAQGYDPQLCKNMHNYLMCTQWVGEIFKLIPIAKGLQDVSGTLKGYFKNPGTMMLGIAFPVTCWLLCRKGGPGCGPCVATMDLIERSKDVYNQIDAMAQGEYWTEWMSGESACDYIMNKLRKDPRYDCDRWDDCDKVQELLEEDEEGEEGE